MATDYSRNHLGDGDRAHRLVVTKRSGASRKRPTSRKAREVGHPLLILRPSLQRSVILGRWRCAPPALSTMGPACNTIVTPIGWGLRDWRRHLPGPSTTAEPMLHSARTMRLWAHRIFLLPARIRTRNQVVRAVWAGCTISCTASIALCRGGGCRLTP